MFSQHHLYSTYTNAPVTLYVIWLTATAQWGSSHYESKIVEAGQLDTVNISRLA